MFYQLLVKITIQQEDIGTKISTCQLPEHNYSYIYNAHYYTHPYSDHYIRLSLDTLPKPYCPTAPSKDL